MGMGAFPLPLLAPSATRGHLSGMLWPNFLVIGAPLCGTTSLYRNLSRLNYSKTT